MKKSVIFVGGVHGVGKSTICSHFAMKFRWPVFRQRQALLQLGKEIGLEWPEVGTKHFDLIETVAERLSGAIMRFESPVALFDCHYAIRSARAVRLNGRPTVGPYVHDLDPTLVQRLSNDHRAFFLLLSADPRVCELRLEDRHPEGVEEDHTLEALRSLADAEECCLQRLVVRNVGLSRTARAINNSNLDSFYSDVEYILQSWGLIT